MSNYNKIMNALHFHFGFTDDMEAGEMDIGEASDCVYEIMCQEHDVIETIAKALDEYEKFMLEYGENNV